jgi:hypothetical protein
MVMVLTGNGTISGVTSLPTSGNVVAGGVLISGTTGQVSSPLKIKFNNDYPGAGGASSNTADKMKLVFYDNSPIDIYSIGVGPSADMQYHAYQGSFGQGSHNFYTENLNRMKIDGSGRITKPYQPYFYSYLNCSSSSGNANQAYGTVAVGLSWSTDRVTVPVAGVYLITFMNIANDTSATRYDSTVAVNGTVVAQALNDAATGYHQKSITVAWKCAASDYIQFSTGNWYNTNGNPGQWITASITLLG